MRANVPAPAIVADSYDFDAAYLEALATGRARASLLVIDDFAALSEYPDGALVLNFTVGAQSSNTAVATWCVCSARNTFSFDEH